MAGFDQPEFDFASNGSEEGFASWRRQREEAVREWARSMGLPIHHPVEVYLAGGIRLRGELRLKEERLFMEERRDFEVELEVAGVAFQPKEIESCVRLDG